MDISFLLFLQNFREATNGVPDKFFLAVTHLGGSTVMILLIVLIFFCINKKAGTYIMFNALIGLVLNNLLKIIFCVYRPWIRDSRVHPLEGALAKATGYSFPSGHTTTAAALWGGLGVTCRKRKWVSVICFIVWALVGFSRLYAGVHTPQDVLVASAIGIILLWVISKILGMLEEHPGRDIFVAVGICVLGIILMIVACVRQYPMDMFNGAIIADPQVLKIDAFSAAGGAVGFAIGWILERRFIGFEVTGGVARKAVRYVICVATILGVKELSEMGAAAVLPADLAAAASMCILIFWIMCVLPLIFKKYADHAEKRASG